MQPIGYIPLNKILTGKQNDCVKVEKYLKSTGIQSSGFREILCLGYLGVRTLCEHAIKIGFSMNNRKFCLNN